MKLSTKDLINVLPFEEEFKKELVDKYDLLDVDQKFEIARLLWDVYDGLFEIKFQENLDLMLSSIADKNGQIPDGLYKEIEEKTEKEFQEKEVKVTEEVDLTEAREAMEKIIKEMRAAKMTPRE